MLVKALLLGAKLSTIADSIRTVIHLISYLTKINNNELARMFLEFTCRIEA